MNTVDLKQTIAVPESKQQASIEDIESIESMKKDQAELIVRRFVPSDLKRVEDLLSQLSTVGTPDQESEIRFLSCVLNNPNHFVNVITDTTQNNKIVACATLFIEEKLLHMGKSRCGHIEDVVVDESVRGRGVGRILIHSLVSEAKEKGCYKCILDCSDENVSFYIRAKAGLAIHGHCMAVYFD